MSASNIPTSNANPFSSRIDGNAKIGQISSISVPKLYNSGANSICAGTVVVNINTNNTLTGSQAAGGIVTSGVTGGVNCSIQLPSVAGYILALQNNGYPVVNTGDVFPLLLCHLGAANNLTITQDAGAQWTMPATLTALTAGKSRLFQLRITGANTGTVY